MYARAVKFLSLTLILLFPIFAFADDMVFRFVDKKGVTHFTDRLGDVPEPYYSMYAAQLRELEEKKKTAKPAPVQQETPNASNYNYGRGVGATQDAQQKKWQQLILKWRAEL